MEPFNTVLVILSAAAFLRRALLLAFIAGAIAGGATLAAQYYDVVDKLLPPAEVETITYDGGGVIGDFIDKYTKWREYGSHVRIDGMCISACTLITGLIPSDRVCVTPRARLAFHSARRGYTHSSQGTRLIWHVYPEEVRALLRAKGWDGDDATTNDHINLIYVEGPELLGIYHTCKET